MKTNTISRNAWDKTDPQITLLCLPPLSLFFPHSQCMSPFLFFSLCCLACTSSSIYCIFYPPSTPPSFFLLLLSSALLSLSLLIHPLWPSYVSAAFTRVPKYCSCVGLRCGHYLPLSIWLSSSLGVIAFLIISCVLREREIRRRRVKSGGKT